MRHADKTAVTVNVTNQCNLRCEYCMAASGKEQVAPIEISPAFAKCGIEDALNGRPTGIAATMLRFFSPGEPSQRMGLVRECAEFARTLAPSIKMEIQTNGLFPSLDETNWIADAFNAVWFSLDGPADVNDRHRHDENHRGRTAEIEQNLSVVAERTFVGVRATVVEETLDAQEDLVKYYHGLGVRYLGLNPVIRAIERGTNGNVEVTTCDIMRFARGFLKAYECGKQLGMHIVSTLTFNFDEETNCACRSCLPMPQLNPDGSVSSCDMALYADTKQELRCFIYGTWNQEEGRIIYDEDKITHLRNRRLPNLAKCRGCQVEKYCAGGCAGRTAYQTGSIYDIIPEYCAATRFLAKYIPLGENTLEYTHP